MLQDTGELDCLRGLPLFLSKKISLYFASCVRKFHSDRGGNIAIAAALMAPVVLGTFGLGTEVASWYSVQRQMQNAADSAASAAATNGSANFADEAKAVTGRYGFTNGQAGVVVTALEKQSCPDGTNLCYLVTVKKPLPLALASLVGYQGNAKIGTAPAQLLTASATAMQDVAPRPYCIVALANSGASPALRTNGAPKADLAGCNVMSNTDAECNGHDLNADVGDAHGTNDGCGNKRNSNVAPIADQYAARASNIPTFPCSTFAQVPKKKGGAFPTVNELNSVRNWGTPPQMCGDVLLTGDTTINTGPEGAVLVIRNGNLDLNGYTLSTSDGSALTIVFTGENGANYGHIPTGGGTLDIRAPAQGVWSGVAMYQNPTLTQNVDISDAGNSPTWKITGLVYLPNADVTFSGAVNKSSYGASCFTLVVDKLLINGTGSILAHGECGLAGLVMPTNPVPSRGKLVS
jgi:hypothetical protein